VRLHRPIRGNPKAITVWREGRRWWVTIRCADIPAEPLPPTGRQVGIDLGVSVLVATSDGALITNERHAQRAAERLARAQQALATKQRGSQHRRRAVERVAAAPGTVEPTRCISSRAASSMTTT
jgi:putative transposase